LVVGTNQASFLRAASSEVIEILWRTGHSSKTNKPLQNRIPYYMQMFLKPGNVAGTHYRTSLFINCRLLSSEKTNSTLTQRKPWIFSLEDVLAGKTT